jgi:hypothetical protein
MVTFERGIFLPELDLWLDPQDERDTLRSHGTELHRNHRRSILVRDHWQADGDSLTGSKGGTLTPISLRYIFAALRSLY